jgi:hypothetical protein
MVYAILSFNFYAWPDGGPSGLKYVHIAFCYIINPLAPEFSFKF